MLDVLLDAVGNLPDPQTEVFIGQLGGATKRVPADATAYRDRDAEFVMNVHGRWEDPANDQAVVAWCRALFDAATPHATGGVYINFMTEEEQERVANAYGDSMDRLVALKELRPALLLDPNAVDELRRELNQPPCLALTATATTRVQADVCERLALRDPLKLVTGSPLGM